MPSLVQELQRDALNHTMPISALLRKALLVSVKLDVKEFEQWARNELEGYKDEAPEYRKLHGNVKVWNPYRGYMPLIFEEPSEQEMFSTMPTYQPVGALEDLCSKDGKGFLQINYSPAIENALMKQMEVALKPTLHISRSAVVSILDRVRSIILDWGLKLEKAGVKGDGFTFSEQEKHHAAHVHIDNYFQGNVENSQIQQRTISSTQTMTLAPVDLSVVSQLVAALEKALSGLRTDTDVVRELRAEFVTLRAQIDSPKPKEGIIRESLLSVRRIAEGAAGKLLADHGPVILDLLHRVIPA